MYPIIFINKYNKVRYRKALLAWIKLDFDKRKQPKEHSWYNKDVITQAMDDNNTLIVFNDQQQIIGYMVWTDHGSRVEIEIVEVAESYQRQGVFKNMQSALFNKYTDICVLSASPLMQSVEKFKNMKDWKSINYNEEIKYIRIVKSILKPLDKVPDGYAIGVCSEHYGKVRLNPDKYKSSMQYFQIHLVNGKLREPIVIPFCDEGYVAVYINQELIVASKSQRLFNNTTHHLGYLIIHKMEPKAPQLTSKKEFSHQAQHKTKSQQRSTQEYCMKLEKTIGGVEKFKLVMHKKNSLFSKSQEKSRTQRNSKKRKRIETEDERQVIEEENNRGSKKVKLV